MKKQLATIAIVIFIGASLIGCSRSDNDDRTATTHMDTTMNMGQQAGQHSGMDMGTMSQRMETMNAAMVEHLGAGDAEYDLRFIDMMIPHHEGAVLMAKDAIQKSKHPEVRKMAEGIIAAQEKEIAQLKAWREAWYKR